MFNEDMIRIFGDPLNPGDGADDGNIRTTEAMNKAIYALYWYRVDNGLEMPVYFDEPYIDPTGYAMCSANTQKLGDLYRGSILGNCCDDRPMNFYPLLDRIVEWMD
jgi:hypothetical protein